MTNRRIFHITHLDNLAGIVAATCLWSDSQRIKQSFANTNIGYSHIKARRLAHQVTVAMGGVLGDYVPFNFCPRSVMLYVVAQGHVNYSGGQANVLHLASSIDSVAAANRPWFFTDRHADLTYAAQFDDLKELNHVDWSVMPLKWWRDPDVKEKRQAEFLVHDWFPLSAVEEIGVSSAAVKQQVEQLLAQSVHQPPVVVRSDWYY